MFYTPLDGAPQTLSVRTPYFDDRTTIEHGRARARYTMFWGQNDPLNSGYIYRYAYIWVEVMVVHRLIPRTAL